MTAPALAKIRLDDKREIDLHAAINVLLVDDDQRFLDTARNYLEQDLGCRVDAVRATKDAVHHLKNRSYHLVVADLNFDPPETMQGAQFIADNIMHMGDARVVAITGQAYYAFKTKPELARLGVEVIDKGEDVYEELNSLTAHTVAKQRAEVTHRLQEAVSSIAPGVGVAVKTKGDVSIGEASEDPITQVFKKQPRAAIQRLYDQLEAALTNYLKVLPNTNEKCIVVGDQNLTLKELIEHIEDGTDVGLAQMDILIMQFKEVLRLER